MSDLIAVAYPDVDTAVTVRDRLIDMQRRKLITLGDAAVVVISQDLDELIEMADQIAVIANGRLSPPRRVAEVTIEELGLLMGGVAAPLLQERRNAVPA